MRFFLLLFFITTSCFAQDSSAAFKVSYYTKKIEKYLDKEKTLVKYYSVDKEGIKIFSSAENKLKKQTEFKISWEKLDDLKIHFNSCTSTQVFANYKKGDYDKMIPCVPENNLIFNTKSSTSKLSGYRIVIDPGHIAGDLPTAEMEKRHIRFKKDSLHGLVDSINFSEAMLAFAVAKLLQEKLESAGASVFMTRTNNGYTAFGKSYDQWLKENFKKHIDSLFLIKEISADKKKWFLTKANKNDKFRLIFRDLDLQKRSEIINNYHPDFTIIIHFNVDETNTGWTKPGNKNFNMAFVGGALYQNDLSTFSKRFEFLRLIVTDDLEKSVSLSGSVVKSFEDTLKVKSATINDATYLRKNCLATEQKGVYCRNLQLTHYVHGALVYGETLYQDNINECKLLNEGNDKTKNIRVKQVADAYFQGIINYTEKLNNLK